MAKLQIMFSWHRTFLVVLLVSRVCYIDCTFDPFSDSKLYDISWPGKLQDDTTLKKGKDAREKLSMLTTNNEQYECFLPITDDDTGKKQTEQEDKDPPHVLLKSLFSSKKSCTYRMEGYWSYELCHGRHLNQFHENTKGTYDHHYVLGTYKEKIPEVKKGEKISTKKIGLRDYPYYQLTMGGGTPCDLADGQPRRAVVHYICDEQAKDEIVSIKETVTCQYEVIVATNLLCKNSDFRLKEDPVNEIVCHSVGDSPSVPKGKIEVSKHNQEKVSDGTGISYNQVEDVKTVVKGQDRSSDSSSNLFEYGNPMKSFIQGTFCLNGGEGGWWMYEFCYRKHVTQYHDAQNVGKTVITLGHWDLETHKKWYQNKKKELAHKNTIELYYSNGDVCDLTQKPRNVIAKLRCRNDLASTNAIAMYLLEPSSCSYILVIESASICPLLNRRDEFGLIKDSQ